MRCLTQQSNRYSYIFIPINVTMWFVVILKLSFINAALSKNHPLVTDFISNYILHISLPHDKLHYQCNRLCNYIVLLMRLGSGNPAGSVEYNPMSVIQTEF